MDSRRNIRPAYDEPRMMHRGPLPTMEPLPPPELLDNKMATQLAEIEQLTVDNRKLAASYLALRQDLAAAREEAEKIKEHIRSIQNEGDIQIRILLDKIAKTDADLGATDSTKKELQTAHTEARKLMATKLELSAKLEQANKELDRSREDLKKIPETLAELDSLRREYQRLRKTFEQEKCRNTEKVEEMKILENDMIGISEEMERLRGELMNAEKRASNLYQVPYHHLHHGSSSGGFTYAGGGFVNCNGGAVEIASGGFVNCNGGAVEIASGGDGEEVCDMSSVQS